MMAPKTPILPDIDRILSLFLILKINSEKLRMKAAFEHIDPSSSASSFTAYRRVTNYFDFHWHYHPELELTLIEKGRGTRIVGDHTESFSEGDLVLLGKNLPHTWVSESSDQEQSAIVIQFRQSLLSEEQLLAPEYAGISRLFQQAQRGIHFSFQSSIADKLSSLIEMRGLEKITELWRTLDVLSQSSSIRLLASPIYRPSLGRHAEKRLDLACQFIHTQFTRKIPLQEIAGTVGMTETSFCRFFKKMTGKSFTEYVNELRVSRARKLLSESNMPIADVAFASGFESMTHFNRTFLQKNQIPPREYRNRWRDLAKSTT